MLSLVENKEIKRVNISLPATINGIHIPAGADEVSEFGLYPQIGSEPAYDPETQRLTGPVYEFTGKAVKLVYTVEAIPEEELNSKRRAAILDQIMSIQQKALRALIEDEDSAWLDKYRAQIAELRAKL